MNIDEPARPYSREEFLLAAQMAEPQTMEAWLPRVAATMLMASTSPEVFIENPEELVASIQQFAAKMPAELLLVGTMTMIQAQAKADELLGE